MKAIIDRLAHGRPVLALGVRSSRTGEIARIAKTTGHDMIWVDLEHSAMPLDAAAQSALAPSTSGWRHSYEFPSASTAQSGACWTAARPAS